MDKLAFDPKGVRQCGLFYIAISRVKDIKSLYLLNKLEHSNFSLNDKVVIELNKLRQNASYELEYNIYQNKTIDDLTLCSLNTGNLSLHIKDIIVYYDLMSADILCFQETKEKSPPSNPLLYNKYDYIHLYHLHRMLIYYRKILWLRIISVIQKTKLNQKLQHSMLKKKTNIVATVYIAPNANI